MLSYTSLFVDFDKGRWVYQDPKMDFNCFIKCMGMVLTLRTSASNNKQNLKSLKLNF